MIVVKVGGSLYDHPRLGIGLYQWVGHCHGPVLIVPGGGEFVDVVRKLDRVHELGEETSHWLALRGVTLAAQFLVGLLPGAVVVQVPGQPFDLGVLDGYTFCERDAGFAGSLPRTWTVTSDALAARAAVAFRANRLVLLKSIDIPPEATWTEAAQRGWVDEHFPTVVQEFDGRVEVVNFRGQLEGHTHSP